jgi:chemotaxis family two-component system response regulator Rcp1
MDSAPAMTPAEILLVEDNEQYVYLTQRAFGKAKLIANLHHVDNGKKCLEFLRRQPPYASAPVPDIILLDLDMPVMDGRQVLAEIVKDEALKHLAVVVLTSGDEHSEILRMYQLRCNSYICKPMDFDKYVDMIKKFADYWLSVVKLPTRAPGRT